LCLSRLFTFNHVSQDKLNKIKKVSFLLYFLLSEIVYRHVKIMWFSYALFFILQGVRNERYQVEISQPCDVFAVVKDNKRKNM